MKYLDEPRLAYWSNFLRSVELGDRILSVRTDAFSCESSWVMGSILFCCAYIRARRWFRLFADFDLYFFCADLAVGLMSRGVIRHTHIGRCSCRRPTWARMSLRRCWVPRTYTEPGIWSSRTYGTATTVVAARSDNCFAPRSFLLDLFPAHTHQPTNPKTFPVFSREASAGVSVQHAAFRLTAPAINRNVSKAATCVRRLEITNGASAIKICYKTYNPSREEPS